MRFPVSLLLAAGVFVAGCSTAPPASVPTADPARALAGQLTVAAMMGHVQRLADIAAANGGDRADATKGYDASVDYVSGVLRDNGFDVETPSFQRIVTSDPGRPTLFVAGRGVGVDQVSLVTPTPPGGLTAPVRRAATPAGCTAADYGPADLRGALAVVDDRGCSVVAKQDAALGRGAAGLLVVATGADAPPGLFEPDYYTRLRIPVAALDPAADAALRRSNAPVRLVLDARGTVVTSRSVLAQTKTGDEHTVVMAGARLDSPPRSPGANDDGSSVAALLETAVRLGPSPAARNAVRFAFFGGGETGGQGARSYLDGLGAAKRADIALYLQSDALGSTNAGWFTYDGDQSGTPNPNLPAARVPAGSAGIERVFAGYLNLAGKRPADMPLTTAAGYGPFLEAGIPIGGMTTGGTGRKTATQQRLWGGRVGVPFDPNDGTARDRVDNVDAGVLAIAGPAVAFAVGSYANSTGGANGVPRR